MRRLFFAAAAAGLALVAAGSMAAWYFERPTSVRVAVTRDTEDHQLMIAAAAIIIHERENIRLRIVPVESASKSTAALDEGTVDLAVTRSDNDMPKKGQTAVILHRSAMVVMAPGGSAITQVSDLAGRKLGVLVRRLESAANPRLIDVVLGHYDATQGTEKIPLTADQVGVAFAEHKIDALIAIGDPSPGPLSEVVAAVAAAGEGPPVFVPISDGKALAQVSPALEPFEVPRGAFGGAAPRPGEDLQTIGVSTRLMASTRLADGVVGDLVRILFTKRPLIAAMAPVANRMEAPSTEKGAPLPAHPGAAAYLDGDVETFLDKYSDFIYIGAMVLSVLASAAAALASRLTAVNHARSEELMEILLDHLAAAREAPSLTSLDSLEREADSVLAQALDASSLKHLDIHRVTAMGLALDQVRLAIRDRRRKLEAREGVVAPYDPPRIAAGE